MQPRTRTLPAPGDLTVPGAVVAPVASPATAAASSLNRGQGLVDVHATVAALG